MRVRPSASRLLHPMVEADAEGEHQWLMDGGELASLIARRDWSHTTLGPLEQWPETLRTVVNVMIGSRHPMFIVWGDRRILLYNDAYAGILADKHPEALGRPMFEVCGELKKDFAPNVDRAFAGEPVHLTDVEVQLPQPIGTSDRILDLSCTPIRDQSGRVLGVLCTCVDRTERRRAEWRAEAQRDISEKTLETIHEPMIMLHDDLRVRWANRSFYQTFRTTPDETIGRRIYELGNHQWDIPKLRELLERIVPKQETITGFEVEHEFERIGRRIMQLNARRIDHLQLILLAIADVTEQTDTEEALKESERKFRLMADNAPVMIWVSEVDGRCSFMSQSWYAFTGGSADEEPAWLDAVHPDDREHVEATFAVANANHEPFRLECRFENAEGEYRWAINAASPRIDEAGRFLGFVGSIMDITERKHDEQRMKLITAELNHRVKNTLAVVSSMAEQTYRHTANPEQFREAFFERLRSMAKAHGLLTRMKWQGANIDELLQVELEHRVHDTWQLVLDGPPIMLDPDAAMALHMIFHELSTNASKYGALTSTDGRITVRWACRSGDDAGEEVVVHWSESGGPPVEPPKRRGFGTRVLQHTAAHELDGDAEVRYEPDGLKCAIRFPRTGGAAPHTEGATDDE